MRTYPRCESHVKSFVDTWVVCGDYNRIQQVRTPASGLRTPLWLAYVIHTKYVVKTDKSRQLSRPLRLNPFLRPAFSGRPFHTSRASLLVLGEKYQPAVQIISNHIDFHLKLSWR